MGKYRIMAFTVFQAGLSTSERPPLLEVRANNPATATRGISYKGFDKAKLIDTSIPLIFANDLAGAS
jgi:hypothetical protein